MSCTAIDEYTGSLPQDVPLSQRVEACNEYMAHITGVMIPQLNALMPQICASAETADASMYLGEWGVITSADTGESVSIGDNLYISKVDGNTTTPPHTSWITAPSSAQIELNKTNIATNTPNIATNTADIATNTADIATNTAGIATNTAGIATLQTNKANAVHTHAYLPLTDAGTRNYLSKIEADNTFRLGYYDGGWKNVLHFKDNGLAYAKTDGTEHNVWDNSNNTRVSNANGDAFKFENGLLICRINRASIGGNSGVLTSQTGWSYPVSFMSEPSISMDIRVSWVYDMEYGFEGSSANSVWGVFTRHNGHNGQIGNIKFIAVGRWK